MNKTTGIILGVVAVCVAAIAIYMIDIDQTQEAELPTVTVEGGQMPAFDAEVGSVEVVDEEVDVTVPDVEVTMEETTVTVPGIEVNPPSDGG